MKLDSINLEVHYYFNDDSHSMNAFIRNHSEKELLLIIRELSNLLDIQVEIESIALESGGIKQFFKITASDKKSITVAVISALVVILFVQPIGKLIDKCIEQLFEDTELISLQKENLKLDNALKKVQLSENATISQRLSKYYTELNHCDKIDRISFQSKDSQNKELVKEKFVQRAEFINFILTSNNLESIKEENANIEIISPVLKRGKIPWRGIYNNISISFSMQSIEFKKSIENGEINFKNGSTINCSLVIDRKLDENGNEQYTKYVVKRVNSITVEGTPKETSDGRRHRLKKEQDEMQLELFEYEKE